MFEKRRKLAETWDRVIKMYEKDQPDQFADLKKLWNNYQARKIEVVKYYESVISAQDRVATKIFEDFGGALNKAFIRGQEPVSIIHYTRPGTCINCPLH